MQVDRVTQSAANDLFSHLVVDSQLGSILLRPPRNGWSPKCDNLDGGTPVLTLTAVTGWHYDWTAIKLTSLPTVEGAHYWLDKGDLLITRSNTPDLLGYVAIYDGHPHPCIYPDLMMKLSVNQAKASSRFVWWWMQSERVRSYIARNAKGTSPTMKKISQPIIVTVPFPSDVPLSQQREMTNTLDALSGKVATIKSLQDATALQLEGMLPAILDKAFRGEL